MLLEVGQCGVIQPLDIAKSLLFLFCGISEGTFILLRKKFWSRNYRFQNTSNTSLGNFESKTIQGRLLIEDLQYILSLLIHTTVGQGVTLGR